MRAAGPQSLDHLALGGEAFPGEFRSEISRRLKVARLTNLYGPTEATIDRGLPHASSANEARRQSPIGRPIANYSGVRSGRVA